VGRVVRPVESRARYELTPGTQIEFVDDGGTLRLVVRRRVLPSDPAAGYERVMRGFCECDAAAPTSPTRCSGRAAAVARSS
jgi:hypothetical protein